MSLLSPSDPSPSGKFRLLEIRLQSVDLNTSKKKAKTYVNLWTHPDRKLQTGVHVHVTGSEKPKPVWDNEKFVFSIPGNFFDGKNSIVWFEVNRARKGFRDSLIGTTQCNLKCLFKDIDVKKETEFEPEQEEKECIYDTENKLADEEDIRYDNMYEDNSTADIKEEKVEPELKATTSLTVQKGLESKGTLNVEVVVGKGYIETVGNCKWRNLAMAYDAFMGQQGVEEEKKKKKTRSWLCFAGTAHGN